MALAGVAVATVVMADPIEDLLNPEPTATAVAAQATATQVTAGTDGGTVRVYTVSGTDPCEFSVGSKQAGWNLTYQFTKPGTQGKLTNLTTGATVAELAVPEKQYPIAGALALDGTPTRYRIESTGEWGYAIQPPSGTLTETYSRNQAAIPDSTFKRTYCGG